MFRSRNAGMLLLAGILFSGGVLALLATRQGCGGGLTGSGVQLTLQPHEDNVLMYRAHVSLSSPAPVSVEYGNAQVGWLRTPATEPTTSYTRTLLRLRADSTYQVRAFAAGPEPCPPAVAEAQFTTRPLPEFLQTSVLESTGRPSFPLTLVDHRPIELRTGTRQAWLVALDAEGQPVWYYRIPSELLTRPTARQSTTVLQRPNGNLIYMAPAWGFEEITPDGQSVRRLKMRSDAAMELHHDFTILPDGKLLFLGTEERQIVHLSEGSQPVLVKADSLHLLDWQSGLEEKVWSAFEALDYGQRPEHWRHHKESKAFDWTHGNTVSLGPRGNVLLSLRHLDQVISLTPDLRTVEWRLGGVDGSFAFPDPSDRFYGQHAAQEIAPGRVLMLDNGNYRPDGAYTRALELELDFATMTARKAWEYRPRPDLYSEKVGNVIRLPTGTTFINLGWRDDPSQPGLLAEAGPDGTVAWEHWMAWEKMRMVRYKGLPIQSLAGETSVDPT